MTNKIKPVRAKEQISFHCTLCGSCCRNVEEQLMLEPSDAYHLARHLTNREGKTQNVEDIYARYTHPILLEDMLPIFVLNTAGEDHACVFLQNGRCSIYEARPRVCRLYPFTAKTGERGKRFQFYQCFDRHSAHFSGGTVEVGDWMYRSFTKEDREFIEAESAILPELGRLLRSLNKEKQESSLFHLLFYRYYNYALAEPFLPQYQRNHQALLAELRRQAKETE